MITRGDLDQPAFAVSVSRVIPASPTTVWAMIHDVTRMGELSPETTSARWVRHGERFRGSNRIGRFYRWSMAANVTESTAGEVFEFRTDWPSSTTWRYDLEPFVGGTLVTESMRKDGPQIPPVRWMQSAAGIHDRAEHLRAGMSTTLERLAHHFADEPCDQ